MEYGGSFSRRALLLLVLHLNYVNSQIRFGDETRSNVKINTCCELSLGLGRGSIICSDSDALQSPEEITSSYSVKAKRQVPAESDWTVPAFHMSNNEATIFTLINNKPICTSGVKTHQFNTTDSKNVQFIIETDGYIGIGWTQWNRDYYNLNQYCLNGIDGKYVEIKSCIPSCTNEEPCVHKCCPPDKVFSHYNQTPSKDHCEDSGEIKWTPTYYKSPKDPNSVISKEDGSKKNVFYFVRHPYFFKNECNNLTLLATSSAEIEAVAEEIEYIRYRISENGKVWYRDQLRNWKPLDEATMCVDGIQNYVQNESIPFADKEDESILLTCPFPEVEERQVNLYYGVMSVVCSIFALLTVLVYALLWEKQNVHGWTIMSYSTTVFLLFISLGIAHLTLKYNEELLETTGCKILATISHFLFISMFAWLTMISLDLWLTFRTMMISSGRSKGLKRYSCYAIFALGIPALMVILSWSLELSLGDDEDTEVKVPMYGAHVCHVSTLFLWEFVYGVCAILFVLNIIFFGLTTWKLIEYNKSTKLATQANENRQFYILFIKLFFVVGILWMFEIISWASSGSHITIVWQIFDTFNCLQPVAIFFIFVFKYDMINSLAEKYDFMRPCLVPVLKFLDFCERKRRYQAPKKSSDEDEESGAINMAKTNNTNISVSYSSAESTSTTSKNK